MSDSTVLLRDIAGDAATKAAGKVNPSEDQLNQIDKPAEDNTWHEKPDFQGMKQQVRDKVPSKQERQEALGDATQAAHPQGTRDPNAAAADAQAEGSNTAIDPKTGAKSGAQTMKKQIRRQV